MLVNDWFENIRKYILIRESQTRSTHSPGYDGTIKQSTLAHGGEKKRKEKVLNMDNINWN